MLANMHLFSREVQCLSRNAELPGPRLSSCLFVFIYLTYLFFLASWHKARYTVCICQSICSQKRGESCKLKDMSSFLRTGEIRHYVFPVNMSCQEMRL